MFIFESPFVININCINLDQMHDKSLFAIKANVKYITSTIIILMCE